MDGPRHIQLKKLMNYQTMHPQKEHGTMRGILKIGLLNPPYMGWVKN
jgi:hypothetical protein